LHALNIRFGLADVVAEILRKRVAKATRPEMPSWHESATDWQAGVDFLEFFSNLPARGNCRWSQLPSDGKGGATRPMVSHGGRIFETEMRRGDDDEQGSGYCGCA